MVQLHLYRVDQIEATLAALDARIDTVMEPFSLARELLMTVPGISKNVANVIIAEAGLDMDVFDAAGHLASWAGVRPGRNESAGRIKSTQTRPGDHYELGVDHFDKTNPNAPRNGSNAEWSRSDSSPTSPHFPEEGHLCFLSRHIKWAYAMSSGP
ncbi:hypothetical protein QFZ36_000331 [Pseudarthrobacter siccitolerans]|uniref:Transposase IS116/IS110/IS902 C-terminal domain-containing protein n=1 Tax=Pseudarthrobacter siccitolerans TaxID=861266 RepID=A0ABU0PFN4_9MICC|nr:transposase [Pseudarthrobacter siccitolerans]MDQ0672770.1 hypothetical protein [Pseudarthrobacter siccitolerans]